MVSILKMLISFVALVTLTSSYAGGVEKNELIEYLYGTYCVTKIEQYRGGRTSRENALRQLNAQVKVNKREFLFWDGSVYEDPAYQIENHSVLKGEGNVPEVSERFGSFYGVGLERESITTLSVQSRSLNELPYIFEVVDRQLWLFLDGWFYTLEKTSSDTSASLMNEDAHTCEHTDTQGR
ncbi:hypothetical protein [Halomonas sp. TD01]|uniref:hypothetical protein n=1 Tax=Halomonas sp. TD01 TaxID=999141 RepID=UPI000214D504|nr:hypothetical protein [Halomonas sp. TD01]EGP20165.1 hypothetical protein GME_07594 [Halomonas sp. TD01]CAH1043266.1 hypothetical protein HPTD01_1744 [Halomonas sp. TD01]